MTVGQDGAFSEIKRAYLETSVNRFAPHGVPLDVPDTGAGQRMVREIRGLPGQRPRKLP